MDQQSSEPRCPGCGKHCPSYAPGCAFGRRHFGGETLSYTKGISRRQKNVPPAQNSPAGLHTLQKK